jgi:1-acyl-sn-glycerol-3-phosphate acyltransferase
MTGPAPLRAAWRSALFLALTFGLIGPFMLAQATHRGWSRRIVRLWSVGCCRIVGLRVHHYGRPAAAQPALLVANHVSYLDIPVIAAHVAVIFVAKREVATWPLFGPIARIARTIFIDRVATAAARQCRLLRKRLGQGETLLLFPEGTSSLGDGLLPFKSTLFEASHDETGFGGVPVQPVSLAYVGFAGGLPFQPGERELYAWVGEGTMLPHLWRMMRQPGAEVVIRFHPVVRPEEFASRKELAGYAWQAISRGLEHDLQARAAGEMAPEERPAVASG